MNAKAEQFKGYLDSKDIKVFDIEELQDDPQHTVAFRSRLTIEGQSLPTVVIVDDSIFVLIRTQIQARALSDANKDALLNAANAENGRFKPFKVYTNAAGDLLLDVCLTFMNELSGDEIYTIFDSMIGYLNGAEGAYRRLMQAIWSKPAINHQSGDAAE